jgi:hypothetical protein
MVEANAVQALVRAKKEAAMPTLEIWKNLAMRMMTNKLGDNGVAATSPKHTLDSLSINHVLKKRLKKQGIWNYTTHKKCGTEHTVHPSSMLRLPHAHQGLLLM